MRVALLSVLWRLLLRCAYADVGVQHEECETTERREGGGGGGGGGAGEVAGKGGGGGAERAGGRPRGRRTAAGAR
eukprot:9067748-Pyramimonas_sp.AAC.1